MDGSKPPKLGVTVAGDSKQKLPETGQSDSKLECSANGIKETNIFLNEESVDRIDSTVINGIGVRHTHSSPVGNKINSKTLKLSKQENPDYDDRNSNLNCLSRKQVINSMLDNHHSLGETSMSVEADMLSSTTDKLTIFSQKGYIEKQPTQASGVQPNTDSDVERLHRTCSREVAEMSRKGQKSFNATNFSADFQRCEDCQRNKEQSCPHLSQSFLFPQMNCETDEHYLKTEPPQTCSTVNSLETEANPLHSSVNHSQTSSVGIYNDVDLTNDQVLLNGEYSLKEITQSNTGGPYDPQGVTVAQSLSKSFKLTQSPATQGFSKPGKMSDIFVQDGTLPCLSDSLHFTETRRYVCEFCDKSFLRHGHLVTHRRTHTGERPYRCDYCQRAFTQSSALYRHSKTCSFTPAHLKTMATENNSKTAKINEL
ncbi:hypothetical protein Ahia01_001408300 [Argonauta hians]